MHGSDKKMLKKEDSFCCFSYFWGAKKNEFVRFKILGDDGRLRKQ